MDLEILQSQIEVLSKADKVLVYNQLMALVNNLDVNIAAIQSEQKAVESKHCPHCKSGKTIKIGKQYGIQRYKCKDCNKNYRDSTGTFSAGMHKGKGEVMKTYMRLLIAKKSIRYCAKECNVSIPTSFEWRHKILSAITHYQDNTILSGIVESDDVFIRYSQKGQRDLDRPARKRGRGVFEKRRQGITDEQVAIIISQDRKGHKHLKVATRGRISKKDLAVVLKDKIEPGSILCTDTHHSYTAYAKSEKIEHHTIKASAKEMVKNDKYHVQHVNQTAKELKEWLSAYNGVSTKYLQQYLNLYTIQKQVDAAQIPLRALLAIVCTSYSAIQVFKSIPLLQYI